MHSSKYLPSYRLLTQNFHIGNNKCHQSAFDQDRKINYYSVKYEFHKKREKILHQSAHIPLKEHLSYITSRNDKLTPAP